MPKSYYAILGLTSNASSEAVRSAYRRLAKQYHPDVSPAHRGAFQDIQEAYSVLADRSRRETYDEALRDIQSRRRRRAAAYPQPEPLIPEQRPADMGDISPIRSFETIHPSFDQVFDWLWSNFRSLSTTKAQAARSLTLEIPITRQQARTGGHARILVPARATCPVCHGHGGISYYECTRCGGEGMISGEYPVAVAYPAGLVEDHSVLIALNRFGIRNMCLTVNFRLTDDATP